MAEGHEERRREMIVEITRTFQLLQAVLADLPIPLIIGLRHSMELDEVDAMWERTRQLIRDEPISDEAANDLDLAILMFLSAFDVSHLGHHRGELHWRDDATFAALAQSTAYLGEAVRVLRSEQG